MVILRALMMLLTHLGARPRPVHRSDPFGFLNLATTLARLSVFLEFFWAFLPTAILDFLLRVAKSRLDKSFNVKLCVFKTANISRAAALRFARVCVSKAICFAV